MKLTLRSVQAAMAIYPVKVTRNQYREYVVKGRGIEYFTDDLEDAFRTAWNYSARVEFQKDGFSF